MKLLLFKNDLCLCKVYIDSVFTIIALAFAISLVAEELVQTANHSTTKGETGICSPNLDALTQQQLRLEKNNKYKYRKGEASNCIKGNGLVLRTHPIYKYSDLFISQPKVFKRKFSASLPLQISNREALDIAKENLKKAKDDLEKLRTGVKDEYKIYYEQKYVENIKEMEKIIENYKKILKMGVIDFEGVMEAINTLIMFGPQLFEQLVTGILNFDLVLVGMALSKLLSILFKIFCKSFSTALI